MSDAASNTSLSRSARLFCYLGPPSTVFLTAVASPRAAIVAPITFLPPAWLYTRWRKPNANNPSCRGQLEPMIWIFAVAGTIGVGAAAAIQTAVLLPTVNALFGSGEKSDYFWQELTRTSVEGLTSGELTQRAALASSWQNWTFNAVLSFGLAGLAEELLKYLSVVYVPRRHGSGKEDKSLDRAYMDYAAAAALGFGTVENIGFLMSASRHESWPRLLLTLSERILLGSVGHVALGTMSALRATRRDYYGDAMSLGSVIAPAVLCHGIADFVALSASALGGNVGWIHPQDVPGTVSLLSAGVAFLGTELWLVRRWWRQLDERNPISK